MKYPFVPSQPHTIPSLTITPFFFKVFGQCTERVNFINKVLRSLWCNYPIELTWPNSLFYLYYWVLFFSFHVSLYSFLVCFSIIVLIKSLIGLCKHCRWYLPRTMQFLFLFLMWIWRISLAFFRNWQRTFFFFRVTTTLS